MTTLSSLVKNGQQLQLQAGVTAINVGDLVQIGSWLGQAYPVKIMDYATQAAAGAILGDTVTAATGSGADRVPVLLCKDGTYLVAGGLSNAVILKRSASGAALSSVTTGVALITNMFFLSNGLVCIVGLSAGLDTAANVVFQIYDANLNLVTAVTTVGAYFSQARQYGIGPHGIPLSGGGFAITYVVSANTSVNLAVYSNTGAQVLAPTAVYTYTAGDSMRSRLAQLQNGDLVLGMSYTNTGQTAGSFSFMVLTTAGAVVVANTVIASPAYPLWVEISVLGNVFCIGGEMQQCGTSAPFSYIGVYNSTGALQGSLHTGSSGTQSSGLFGTNLKIINDGASLFWIVGQLDNLLMSFTTGGVGTVYTNLSPLASTGVASAVDMTLSSDGFLLIITAGQNTASDPVYYSVVEVPNASLGTTYPSQIVALTQLGTETSGLAGPAILSAGDFTFLCINDQAGSINIIKFLASAIIGVSQTAVAAGNAGTLINVIAGPGSYPINSILGVTGGVSYNHTSASPIGGAGSMFTNGVTITTAA